MGKFLKDNWFVAVIAVFFVAITIYFVYDQNKDKLPGKTVDGKQVVFAVDDQNTTADDLYDKLAPTYERSVLYSKFQTTLLDEAVETTDEMTSEVDSQVQDIVSYYQSCYGYGVDTLNNIVKSNYGYDTLADYLLYTKKAQQVYSEYIAAHLDELYDSATADTLKGRIISYCVISMDDPANPTEDESKLLSDAQAAWASGDFTADNFADFAKNYSQDSGAQNGGKLGYVDTNTSNLDEDFLNAALQLESGAVSDWVYSQQFGWFLIKCDTTDPAELAQETDFVSAILDANSGLDGQILWAKAQELNVSFADDETEQIIKEVLGVADAGTQEAQ